MSQKNRQAQQDRESAAKEDRRSQAKARVSLVQRPLSLYLRGADETTFYNANVLLPSQLGASAQKGMLYRMPTSKDQTLAT